MPSLSRISATICVFFIFSTFFSDNAFMGVMGFGINYGQIGNNLPPPTKVFDLLSSLKLTKVRIYDTNPEILTAFANSNIELIVTVENEILGQLKDPQQALQWVSTHIKPYIPATKITGIAVGNEILGSEDMNMVANLVPAIVSIHGALAQLGLERYIKVSTPCSLGVLEESYPPSAGSFKSELNGVMLKFLQFLSSTNSPFWINAYPYFAYKDDPSTISLNYVLFNPSSGMVDPNTKLHYDNMLYAQVDAVIFAIARLGFGGLEVRVSETGWPSNGDQNEIGASLQNAAIYNKNLLRRQFANEGTPLRPQMRLEVYLFALFNENMKPGPTSERNYGLYQPDCTMVYNVGLYALTTTTTTSTSTSSFFLSSSADKAAKKEYKGLLCSWIFLYFLIVHVLMQRPYY